MHADILHKIEGFPRLGLGHFPSPLRQMPVDGGGSKAFWLKDDGGSSLVYGGNKVRKLEYLLAEARRRNQTRLVVPGDIESHTVRACCLLGRKAGFEVDAVIFPHKRQSFDQPEVQQLADAGVCLHRRRNMISTLCFAHALGLRRSSYLVPLGGSTPLSTLGYVRAAIELSEQVRHGLMPEPERIFIPFATGGSVAGLLIGLALLQSSTQIVAVQTVDGVIANPRRLGRLIKSTLALIGTDRGFYGACMERLQTIDRRFLGKGYRDVPASVSAAVELASLNALELEPVFSGKALASLLDTRKQDDCIELLFWNTHDQQSNSVVAQ